MCYKNYNYLLQYKETNTEEKENELLKEKLDYLYIFVIFSYRPQLKFITWTKSELEPSEKLQHLNIIPPHVGIEVKLVN